MDKRSYKQANFQLMGVREDLLEADDIDARGQSLREAKNLRALASRAVEGRPGSTFLADLTGYDQLFEIRPADGLVYTLAVATDKLLVADSGGAPIFELNSVPWPDLDGFWVQTFREKTILGHGVAGIFVLELSQGNWTLSPFVFDAAPGGDTAQPYWVFTEGIELTPSSRTGAITLTASANVFTAQDVGQIIRYGQREILVTGFTNGRNVSGTVQSPLPPSFQVSVGNGQDFQPGQVVVGADTNFQGIVNFISGNLLNIFTIRFFDGPDTGEILSSPKGSSKVLGKTAISPLPSVVWDEPVMSPKRGYPRSGSAVGGRLVLVDFPEVPDLVVCSSARSVTDFQPGAAEDDAIVRQSGDDVPRFLHAINAGDLILLSDRGCYYVETRGNGVLSPATFRTILFDKRAAAPVPPQLVDDGVAFLDSTRRSVLYASLIGNLNLRWRVRNMTVFHQHTINKPIAICGAGANFRTTEKYLLVVNQDGTIAAVSWRESLDDEAVGFVQWETTGQYRAAAPVFDRYLALVDRDVNGETRRYLEVFDESVWLDCAVIGDETVRAEHLPLTAGALMVNDGFAGAGTIAADGSWQTEVGAGAWQMGLSFEAVMSPWPQYMIDSPRRGMVKGRVVRFAVAVQDTATFTVQLNGTIRRVGGYSFGDDLGAPPPRVTQLYRFPILGNRDYPNIRVIRENPGPFRVLAFYQEVSG